MKDLSEDSEVDLEIFQRPINLYDSLEQNFMI